MAAYKGINLIIKIGDGAMSEVFTAVGGVRNTQIDIAQANVAANHLESGAWQTLLPSAGLQHMVIAASGVFTDSATEDTLRQLAISGANRNFQILFPNGDTATGAFQLKHYMRKGNHDDEEQYNFTIESAGAITYVAI